MLNINSDQDLLKYALSNGIIDLSYVQEQINMKQREEIIKNHPYKIWEGYDGKWHTYLPDEEKGRVAKKNKTYDGLVDLIVEDYRLKEKQKKEARKKPQTFIEVYYLWRKTHDLKLSDNSIVRYDTDFRRYFEGSDFGKTLITEINSETVEAFILNNIKEKKLCKKACKTLFGYIKNTIKSAKTNKLISDNPIEDLKANQFYDFCIETERPKDRVVITDKRWKIIDEQIEKDKQKNPSYLPVYAIQLAMLTGFRVGELSALRWDSITDKYIIIDKSERYNRKTREYYIAKTKNKKIRIYPLTKEIKKLLDDIKKVSIQAGILTEWVFSNENGRINAPVISSCIKNKCIQLGIEIASIHACRRTVNSKLRCNGVSATVAASLLGHTEQVNEEYYTFDVSSIEEKTNIVSIMNAQVSKCV